MLAEVTVGAIRLLVAAGRVTEPTAYPFASV
jgi:hypothetical protein